MILSVDIEINILILEINIQVAASSLVPYRNVKRRVLDVRENFGVASKSSCIYFCLTVGFVREMYFFLTYIVLKNERDVDC